LSRFRPKTDKFAAKTAIFSALMVELGKNVVSLRPDFPKYNKELKVITKINNK
jgi:hypothetical protein